MSRHLRILAFCLLGLLAVMQSGLPAFIGQAWAQLAMYQKYTTIMSSSDALDLVLKNDLGCGYFDGLEELTQTADTITLGWLTAQQPLVFIGAHCAQIMPPDRPAFLQHYIIDPASTTLKELDPPPPRAVEGSLS